MNPRIVSVFLMLLVSFVLNAQTPGIAVQGIARDANKAALTDQLLTFIFEIQEAAGGTSYYKEDISIRTDAFGVFSHIIGTGNVLAGSGDFIDIPFGQRHMKLIMSVTYNGNTVILSNAPFQYAPYAKSADNGVPTGTIVAFAGDESRVPAGWVLCDGRSIAALTGAGNLRNIIGNNVPDLRGMFLRGTGTNTVNNQPGPALRATQGDDFKGHNHSFALTAITAGAHTHGYKDSDIDNSSNSGDHANGNGTGSKDTDRTTNNAGDHSHQVTGNILNTGGNETRPVNYGVNYIIKL